MFSKKTTTLINELIHITSDHLTDSIHEYFKSTQIPLKILYYLIHNNYNQLYNKFKQKQIGITITKTSQPIGKLDTIIFLNDEERKVITKLPLTYKFEVTHNTNTLCVVITSDKRPTNTFLYRLFSKCFLLIDVFANKHNKVYNVYVWLSNLKKLKPLYKSTYEAKHINSGATVHHILEQPIDEPIHNFELEFEKISHIPDKNNVNNVNNVEDDTYSKYESSKQNFEKQKHLKKISSETVSKFEKNFEKNFELSNNKDVNDDMIMSVNSHNTSTMPPVELFIWRKEEFEKVLVHELIHTLKLDFLTYPEQLTKDILNYFNIPTDTQIRVGEAYVETWAVIINTILISKSVNNFFEHFEKEVLFSLFQSSKIMHHFGYNCLNKCKMSMIRAHVDIREGDLRQETSVFSYFILKTGILLHIHSFIKCCVNNNGNLIMFGKSPKDFKEFHKVLLLITQNTKGAELLQQALNEYKPYLQQKSNNKKQLHKTMRMTLYEY